MRNIPFSPPDITELEIQEVCEALRSGWITTGPRTKQLEKELAEYCHVAKLVCLNSATAAEEMNLRVLGVGEGDEVLVPAYTYTATAAAAIHVGATVKFIDSRKDSLEMDYDQMERAITERTKAVIPVDLGGIPCDYDRIYQAVEGKKALFCPQGRCAGGTGPGGRGGRLRPWAGRLPSRGAYRRSGRLHLLLLPRREELHHRRGRCIGVAHAAGS